MRRAALLAAAVVVLSASPAKSLTPLGSEFRANTYTTGAQRFSSVASDSAGGFVVVWQSGAQDGSGDGIFGRRFSSGGGLLGTEFRVNSYAAGDQAYPSAASASGGNFVVVWQSKNQDLSGDGIFARRFSSSGAALGTDFQVNSYTTGSQFLPDVAADAGGDFVVVWEGKDRDGSDYGVFGRLFSSAGTPTGVEFQVSSFTTSSQILPASVAAGADGDFVVAWTSFGPDGSSSGVFGRRFASSGDAAGTEFRINSFTTGYQSRPSVSSDADANLVVVWTSYGQDGDLAGVFGQRFASSGEATGTEFAVNSTVFDAQNRASVASDAGGSFVVAWNGYGAYGYDVFAQHFSSNGARLGTQLQVNTYAPYTQALASVAAGATGNFVVVWNSTDQDASDYGVFGRRFFDDDFIFQDGFESGYLSVWLATELA